MKKGASVFYFIFLGFIVILVNFVSAVRINEVNARNLEFVEIYNDNNDWINLTNWRIKDNTTTINNITCYTIENCSLFINYSYFVIIGRNLNITNVTLDKINYFYTDKDKIGYGLNDDNGENVSFFNSTFSTSFYYSSSHINKSWQFYNNSWQACEPTPGRENFCTPTPPANTTTPQNSTANQTQQNQTQEIIISLDYDSEIYNNDEFEVKVTAENLEDYDYDAKIYIEYDEKVISQIYDEEADKWISGRYYIDNILSGPGEDSYKFSIRLVKDWINFTGKAKIYLRIRKTSSGSYEEESDSIKFTKKAEKQNIIDNINNSSIASMNKAEGIIKLEGKDIKSYKSRSEYIKEYSIYGFTLFLAVLLITLAIWKKLKANREIY